MHIKQRTWFICMALGVEGRLKDESLLRRCLTCPKKIFQIL